MMTKDDLNKTFAPRTSLCAITGDLIQKGTECWWVQDVGLIRSGQCDPEETLAKLNSGKTLPPPKTPTFSYRDLCEDIAQELEEALTELKRRGIDYHFDTDGLVEYRDLHPRQDS